jgi:hypothetical protein
MELARILRKYTFIGLLLLALPCLGEDSMRDLASPSNKVEYFAEFYSYQGPLGLPTTTHTFARFVKTINGKVAQKVDISWLPKPEYMATSKRVPLFSSVPGKNYTLEETLLMARQQEVIHHGKFSIAQSLFDGAVARNLFLESGKLPYRMLSSANSDTGVNCIHAVLGSAKDISTGLKSGEAGTEAVIDHFTDKKLMTRLTEKTTLNPPPERAPLFPRLKNPFQSHQ